MPYYDETLLLPQWEMVTAAKNRKQVQRKGKNSEILKLFYKNEYSCVTLLCSILKQLITLQKEVVYN